MVDFSFGWMFVFRMVGWAVVKVVPVREDAPVRAAVEAVEAAPDITLGIVLRVVVPIVVVVALVFPRRSCLSRRLSHCSGKFPLIIGDWFLTGRMSSSSDDFG